MISENVLSNQHYTVGSVRINLIQGDVLSCPTDILLCPVDQKGITRGGLYGILTSQGVFNGPPLGKNNWLAIGDCVMNTVQNFPFDRVILISLFLESLGNSNRTMIRQGLTKALMLADSAGAVSVSTPMLGLAKSKLDYGILSGMMIKGVTDFAEKNPVSVRRVLFNAYNKEAFLACESQFISFNQTK